MKMGEGIEDRALTSNILLTVVANERRVLPRRLEPFEDAAVSAGLVSGELGELGEVSVSPILRRLV
jgi:hypothetical protein